MNPENPVVKLCTDGSRAEFEGRFGDACALYGQAWEMAANDYEACIAAHYVARCQESPEQILRWNQEALDRANVVNDETIRGFYPSLYLNMGRSHELLGNGAEAQRYYDMAADLGAEHRAL